MFNTLNVDPPTPHPLYLAPPQLPPRRTQEGRWVIYNDEKVAESAHPPTQLGYLYMYKRLEHLEQENGGTAAGNGAVSGQGGAVAVAGVDTVMQDT